MLLLKLCNCGYNNQKPAIKPESGSKRENCKKNDQLYEACEIACDIEGDSPYVGMGTGELLKRMKVLIEQGANVDYVKKHRKGNRSCLWIACCWGHYDAVGLLLDKNANPNRGSAFPTELTPMEAATWKKYDPSNLVEVFNSEPRTIKRGCALALNFIETTDQTRYLERAVYDGAKMKHFIACPYNATDSEISKIYERFIYYNKFACVIKLVERGANITQQAIRNANIFELKGMYKYLQDKMLPPETMDVTDTQKEFTSAHGNIFQ